MYRIILTIVMICIFSSGCKQEHNENLIKDTIRVENDGAVYLYVLDDTKCNYRNEMNIKNWEIQKELILSRKYQDAVRLLPEVVEEAGRRFGSKESELEFIHLLYTYLYIMAGMEEEAIVKSDEIFFNNQEVKHTCFSRSTRIAVLSRHGRSDEIISESKKILDNLDVDPYYQLISFMYLSMAYLVKDDIEKGRHYIGRLEESFSNLSIPDDDKEKSLYFGKMIDLIKYYSEHLHKTHFLRYSRSLPHHPIRDNQDKDRLKIIFGLDCSVEIVSKKDGSIFTYDNLKAIRDKEIKKPLYDPFTEELNRVREEKSSPSAEP